MSGLSVDTDALRALALRMGRSHDEVAYAARLVDDCSSAGVTFGAASASAAATVTRAMSDFDDHWRYGLKRLIGNLDACRHALHDAAAAYEQVEHSIAQAASGD